MENEEVNNIRNELPPGFDKITEGKATIIFKKFSSNEKEEQITNNVPTDNNDDKKSNTKKKNDTTTEQEVFYNPAMETNRDISVAAAQVYINTLREEEKLNKRKRLAKEDMPLKDDNRKGIRILEALSATGLRSIRYAKEVEGIHSILCNDIDPSAIEAIKRNIEFNNLSTSIDSDSSHFPPIIPNLQDAVSCMYSAKSRRYDLIDIDPYGSPSIFLDSAIQSVKDGGILGVTATDMAVLCGQYPEVCYSKYSGTSLKGHFCHEMGLRILLMSIESQANKFKRYIVPLLSLSIDYYVRIFVRVYTSADKVKHSASKMGFVLCCSGCANFHIQPLMNAVPFSKKPPKRKPFCPPTQKNENDSSLATAHENNNNNNNASGDGDHHQKNEINVDVGDKMNIETTKNNNKNGGKMKLTMGRISFPTFNGNQATCSNCNSLFHFGGPMWIDSIYDPTFLSNLMNHLNENKQKFNSFNRLYGLLSVMSTELVDQPLFYDLPHLSNVVHINTPPLRLFKAAIINRGYKVSGSHTNPDAIKTNAPNDVIWDIIRCWEKNNPSKRKAPNTPSGVILAVEPKFEADFTIPEGMEKELCKQKRRREDDSYVPRFLPNPTANWGPKARAVGKKKEKNSSKGKNKKVKLENESVENEQ